MPPTPPARGPSHSPVGEARRTLVVVPAYNEADTIEAVVKKALVYAPVLVVNDGSTDRTGAIAASIPGCEVITHQKNTHIPGAIIDGFRSALAQGYDYAVTMDAGLSHDPDLLGRLIVQPPSDLVLTYRAQTPNTPWRRRLLSRTAAYVVNAAIRRPRWMIWKPGFRDVTSGYRRYSRRAMSAIITAPMVCRSFDFHLEALAVISYADLSITEFPITYVFSNSSLNARVVRQAFGTWIRLMAGLHRRP